MARDEHVWSGEPVGYIDIRVTFTVDGPQASSTVEGGHDGGSYHGEGVAL